MHGSDWLWLWPALSLALLYAAIVGVAWRPSRTVVPLWTLLLFLIVPPFFPFLLVYVAFAWAWWYPFEPPSSDGVVVVAR